MERLTYNPYRETKDRQPLPWLLARAKCGQEQVNQQSEIPKSNPFAVMMNASRQQALQQKRQAGDPPIEQRKKQATACSAVSKVAAASRTANKKCLLTGRKTLK